MSDVLSVFDYRVGQRVTVPEVWAVDEPVPRALTGTVMAVGLCGKVVTVKLDGEAGTLHQVRTFRGSFFNGTGERRVIPITERAS